MSLLMGMSEYRVYVEFEQGSGYLYTDSYWSAILIYV